MHTFRTQAAQGDLLIRRIDALPPGLTQQPEDQGGGHIVAHSETGHHHRLVQLADTGEPSSVCYLRMASVDGPEAGLRTYVEIGEGGGAVLRHERSYHTHAPIKLAPGIYEFRRQREHTPEGWRRVED